VRLFAWPYNLKLPQGYAESGGTTPGREL